MANVFSGLFSQSGGSGAGGLALYQQQLKDYEEKRKAYEQRQALEKVAPELHKAFEGFGPERKQMGLAAIQMMNNPATYDKGSELLNKIMGQRGSMIEEAASQSGKFDRFKKERDYKLGTPDPLDRPEKIQVYEAFSALGDGSGKLTQRQLEFLIPIRKEEVVDLITRFQSLRDPTKSIEKEIAKAEWQKAFGKDNSARYLAFNDTLDQTDTFMTQMKNRRSDVQNLYGLTRDNTTGWYAMFQEIPGTPAKKWQDVKQTVVSNIAVEELIRMKESSSAGASGFGALSEKELEVLERIMGYFEQTSGPEELKLNLRRLDNWYAKLERTRKQKLTIMNRKNRVGEKLQYFPKEYQYVIPESQKYLLNIPGAEMVEEESPLTETPEEARERILRERKERKENNNG